jgi:hypothetical protein
MTEEATIISWSDTMIEADFDSCPNEVTVAAVFGTDTLDICPGDVTGDGTVNFEDLAILKANYFQSCSSATCGDLNSDNTVNFADLAILKANFFNTCP